ncbi:MAG: hypothetical protein ABI920_19710 [Casimicrobiaceae bacterium]
MHKLLLWLGRLAGLAGVLVIGVAVATRLQGRYVIFNYQTGTLLLAGIALMVLGCLAYLALLAEQRSLP